ncbi:condensation domain-containing protein, partial [Streptomyces sp. URMC 127]|uniref:condensation domain-containing protein n=1 Tax=Streptomyces sp. URMC 127 TaxID=3423402 RepID=UPI003F1D4832
RLISRIRTVLGVELPIRALFETPTPAGLAHRVQQAVDARPALTARTGSRQEPVPLSFAQQRLWFLHKLEGPSATYNMPLVFHLAGDFDEQALRDALDDVVLRHEALRTVFPETAGRPRQRVLEPAEARVPWESRRISPQEDLHTALIEAAGHPFDLSSELPVRAWSWHTGPAEHAVLVLIHHIAGDGWSMGPLARDLVAAYTARRSGGEPSWEPLPVQYADYTLWQRDLLGDETDPGSAFARQIAYWKQQLAGLPETLALPADRPRPATASYRGAHTPFSFDAELHRDLERLARRCDATLFMVLQAALAALLTKLGAGTDIPLGAPVAGRTDEALDGLAGFFVNTLVLRTDTSGNPAFGELIERVRETSLAAYAHQDVPFEYVVEAVNPRRSAAHHPLFQVALALQNSPRAEFALPDLTVRAETADVGTARFDLLISLTEQHGDDGDPAGATGFVEYATDLFDQATVDTLMARWVRLLRTVVADPGRRVEKADILTSEEREQVLAGRKNDERRPESDVTLAELFQARAKRTPRATAVVCGEESLSYGELNARANRLAHWLVG